MCSQCTKQPPAPCRTSVLREAARPALVHTGAVGVTDAGPGHVCDAIPGGAGGSGRRAGGTGNRLLSGGLKSNRQGEKGGGGRGWRAPIGDPFAETQGPSLASESRRDARDARVPAPRPGLASKVTPAPKWARERQTWLGLFTRVLLPLVPLPDDRGSGVCPRPFSLRPRPRPSRRGGAARGPEAGPGAPRPCIRPASSRSLLSSPAPGRPSPVPNRSPFPWCFFETRF